MDPELRQELNELSEYVKRDSYSPTAEEENLAALVFQLVGECNRLEERIAQLRAEKRAAAGE